jgi:glycosyltransferase involved in cell wall biosynthesis
MSHVVVIGGFAPSLVLFRAPLLAEMVRRGHRVTAFAADGSPEIETRLSELGVRFEPLALERAGSDPVADARTLASLTRQLRSLRPDVVFAYTLKPVLYGLLAARFAGIRRRFAMLTGLGYSFLGQERWSRRALRRGVSTGLRIALDRASGLFVQNPDDLRDLGAAGAIPRTLAPIIVRGSGVDLAHYAPVPLPVGPQMFLFVGRLLREKGFDEFVELARRIRAHHPEVRFRAVGWIDPNPASVGRAELDRWVADGTIEYAGEVTDVRPHIAACHVLVLPSYREGTPRSVLEAMSMARTVIVTDAPGCRETIEHGVHGWLVPVRDVDALVGAAERVISEPSAIATMGRRARERAEQLYDARAIANQMADAMAL